VTRPLPVAWPWSPDRASRPLPGTPGQLHSPSVADVRLLFVCTGNICRSPVAERLTLALAEQALGPSAVSVRVRSAGVGATDGRAMEPNSAQALVELGGNPEGFTSRQIQPGDAEGADLTLTMTSQQRHQVLKRSPRALRRTFTLAEARALLELVGSRDANAVVTLPIERRAVELAARLNEARTQRRTMPADDILDPIGQPRRVHREVAETIDENLEPLARLLFAALPPATVMMAVPVNTRNRGDLLR
jgi:protein-tyrosine phosphatase